MKFIKVISATVCVAAIAACVMFSSGCKTVVSTNPSGQTVTNQVLNADAITPVIAGVVPIGVQVAIAKDTNTVTYFKATTVVLDTLVANGTYKPEDVSAALSGLKVTNAEAKLAVDAGLIIYKSFAAQAVTQKLQSTQVLPVLQALSDAIKQGVAYSTPSPSGSVAGPALRSVTIKVN